MGEELWFSMLFSFNAGNIQIEIVRNLIIQDYLILIDKFPVYSSSKRIKWYLPTISTGGTRIGYRCFVICLYRWHRGCDGIFILLTFIFVVRYRLSPNWVKYITTVQNSVFKNK